MLLFVAVPSGWPLTVPGVALPLTVLPVAAYAVIRRVFVRGIRQYLRRDFHPDDNPNQHLARDWFAAHGYPDEMSVHADEVEDPCCRAHARWT